MIVGAAQQGDVVGVLEVGETDDARMAVRAAAVVAAGKAIDSEDAEAAPCETAKGGAADAARADHDDVRVVGHRGRYFAPAASIVKWLSR